MKSAARPRRPRAEPRDDLHVRSFTCTDALYREFEARAIDLECSLDWLFAEAMQRLLAETKTSRRSVATAMQSEARPIDRDRTPEPAEPPSASEADMDLLSTAAWALALPPPEVAEEAPEPEVAEPEPERITLCIGRTRVNVDRDRFVIGRKGREVDLLIDHEAVSRRHAVLERTAEGWMAFDLGSTNGMLVNGTFAAGSLLRPGDVLSIGPVVIAVERA